MTQIIFLSMFLSVWQNPTPVCTASGDQENFLALPYADGGVLVLWEDYRNGDADIFAQAMDADGNALWQENGIPVITETGDQTQLDAIVLESGDAVVAWNDERVSGQHSVYAQRIAPGGSLVWNAGGVPIITDQIDLTYPHLCQSNEGAVVEWVQGGTYPRFIKTRRILANGNVVWSDTGITICEEHVVYSDMTPAHLGGTIISYRDDYWENGSRTLEYRVQKLDSLGTFLWGDSGILLYSYESLYALQPEDNLFNKDISDDSGGAIIFWWTTGQQHAQRVDSIGTLLWGDTGIVIAPPINALSPIHPGGIYLVRSSVNGHEKVYAHRLTLDGETLWIYSGIEIWTVWAYDPRGAIYPYVTEDGIITWRDVYDEGDPYGDKYEERGILAQRIDTTGNILWPVEVLVCGTTGSNPRIFSTHNKAGIIVWQDTRKGNIDLYATRIDSLGNLPPGIEEHPYSIELALVEVSELATINLTLPYPADISLNVFDVGGRKATGLEPTRYEAGVQPIRLNTQVLAGGVYFVRLNIKALGGGESQTRWAKITVVK